MDLFQQLFIVGAVLAAFGGALWTLQRRGLVRLTGMGLSARADRRLQVIERLQLTPQHSLCLVKLEDRVLLIGTAPSSCSVLNVEGDR